MSLNKSTPILLSPQEKTWLLEKRVTRWSDHKEVQIYPMGAERFLSSALLGKLAPTYPIASEIIHKDVLIIPGHGNNAFLLAQAGAQSVTVYDKDPVTVAWIKAFKKYYHYKEERLYPSIGELLTALTAWYPPLLTLPHQKYSLIGYKIFSPNTLRCIYIHYMLALVQKAIESQNSSDFELEQEILIHTGTVDDLGEQTFDTAFIPYLLGVAHGIEQKEDITSFFQTLLKHVPQGHILVTPSRNTREFYLLGKRYLNIQLIQTLAPYFIQEDKHWLRTQGLAVFGPNRSS